MTRFDSQISLVTGAGGDIGRAVAVALARDGSDVVLADLPAVTAGLEATLDACRAARAGFAGSIVQFDVGDTDAVVRRLAEAADGVGPPQLIVNSAGYQGDIANLIDYDLADLRRVLTVNVTGVFAVLQVSARLLCDASLPGSIVNVASMAAHGAPNMPAYAASKGAVVSLTRAAARDLAPYGIRVNSVSPGFIGPGAMWDRQVALQAETPSPYYATDPGTVADQMLGQVPLRRYGGPDEVADVVCFLLSDEASYLTGSDVEVAGGA